MLPPRNLSPEESGTRSKEDLDGVALAFPDSGSAGNTNTGNAARRCLMREHLRERLIGTVPVDDQEGFRYGFFNLVQKQLLKSPRFFPQIKKRTF